MMTMVADGRHIHGLLDRLTTDDQEILTSYAMTRTWRRGDRIHDAVGLIMSGAVAATSFADTNSDHCLTGLSFHGPKEVFGLEAAFHPDRTVRVDYVVRADRSTILTIPCSRFTQVLYAHPRLMHVITVELAARAHEALRDRLRSTLPTQDRVEIFLLDLARRFGRTLPVGIVIDLTLSQAEIAQAIGISRQAVELQISRLRREGSIVHTGYRQLILSPEITSRLWEWH